MNPLSAISFLLLLQVILLLIGVFMGALILSAIGTLRQEIANLGSRSGGVISASEGAAILAGIESATAEVQAILP